jgi:hypothetical protein
MGRCHRSAAGRASGTRRHALTDRRAQVPHMSAQPPTRRAGSVDGTGHAKEPMQQVRPSQMPLPPPVPATPARCVMHRERT